MKNFFTKLKEAVIPEKKKKFMFTTRNLRNNTLNGDTISDFGLSGAFTTVESLIWSSNDSFLQQAGSTGGNSVTGMTKSPDKQDERKSVQPKEVFNEIKKDTPDISFENLDEKIKMVEDRIEILKEHLDEAHLTDEHRTLFYLRNRKKYISTRKKLPMDWAMTTREAVNDLNKRYKLCTVPLKQFYTLVPKEGIAEMDRYTKAYTAITDDKPIFELIIKDEKKEETRKKDRDPILLANSPLGNFMMVLGAWDDEVEVVDEIIYNGK